MEHPVQSAARRVLVIDDDTVTRRFLREVLEREGFQACEAASGEEGLLLLSSFKPEIILLDVILGGIDGFATCRTFRALPEDRHIPILFISCASQTEAVVAGLEAGGNDYIPKPVKPAETVARVRTHLRLRDLHKSQEHLIEALQQAHNTKNKMLGIASHDLRNPLGSIHGLVDYLREGSAGEISDQQSEILDVVHDGTEMMLELLESFLDISLVETGELALNQRPADLCDLVKASLSLYRVHAQRKGIELQFEVVKQPDLICADHRQLRRVIENLLSNAIKYAPANTTIEVSADEIDERAMLTVRDHGPGIPEGEQGKLFKDFGTTLVEVTSGESSTGLGLAICRKVIEAHNGTISMRNHEEGGACFRISLPLGAEDHSRLSKGDTGSIWEAIATS